MKLAKAIKIKLMIGMVVAGNAATAFADAGRVQNTEMRLCSAENKKCLIVTSSESHTASVGQLHTLKNPVVQLMNSGSKTGKLYKAHGGYVDLDNSKLVLLEKKNNGSVLETFWDLETLKMSTHLIR